MISVETAREVALSMPEAVEGEHMGHPDFRVRKKIFATLWPDDSRAVVFTEPSSHSGLIESHPGCFSLNGWSEKYGALNVHLEAIAESQFRRLVIESWRRKAPKSLSDVSFAESDI